MNGAEKRGPDTDDRLRLSLEATFDQALDLNQALEPFFRALESHAGTWMPEVVEGKRQYTYSRDSVLKALDEKRGKKSMSVGLSRATWPVLDMSLRLSLPPSAPRLYVWISVQPLSLFRETAPCSEFVGMVRAWASHYPVAGATANSLAEDQLAEGSSPDSAVDPSEETGDDRIQEVSWLNVFGPKLVERLGRERMLSTPAHLVEELPNGSVLLVLWPTAADFASDEARVAQARAHVHLRPDLDFDTVLRNLRERSAALAPVEPRFHPDLAPLLSRLSGEYAISERQQKIAELNVFQPPEPEEWLPVALPSDVASPAQVHSGYGDLTEGLMAALHTKVPSILDATPESLTDLDFYFWRENFPERYKRELIDTHTAPALGAYLGGILVKRLGGTWIPRQNPEESQVRVGKRVWLPFLRARRYMASRQSLLTHSLTQFFREAERHRS
ncbi:MULTISPECIES: DUF3396 domain-containing protein [unclassified Corallococcus]|uniref:DUF3396 domain-containing protein n=1 Tax=unclassified Corallococcus TaxID=2685029 RepID=UPI001CBCD8E1|nr:MULTISPECIES: DUF3396 domain-containing protein [unclassified Corallococcus]MBZ4336034.1 DUF3396 domain-containing protein [Corallococcus sp. AS-1-12]MBZ4374581.1 DUF3396 domain-containing protein [Corallococcus sp. AS-1-6]